MTIDLSALTDVGLQRKANEDSLLLWDLTRGGELSDPANISADLQGRAYLLVVADGMGGEVGGQIASQTAVDAVKRYAQSEFDAGLLAEPGKLTRWLARAIEDANRNILERVRQEAALKGMGTTMTAAMVFPKRLVLVHVGDSRLYHLRDGQLRQLTVDHTRVQQLIAMGRLSPQEARGHEHQNLLLQAVGTDHSLEIDRVSAGLEPADKLLLCTDGLHGLVEEEEMQRILSNGKPPAEQCHALIERAKARGGSDNITAIIAHIRK